MNIYPFFKNYITVGLPKEEIIGIFEKNDIKTDTMAYNFKFDKEKNYYIPYKNPYGWGVRQSFVPEIHIALSEQGTETKITLHFCLERMCEEVITLVFAIVLTFSIFLFATGFIKEFIPIMRPIPLIMLLLTYFMPLFYIGKYRSRAVKEIQKMVGKEKSESYQD